jgi:UDP-glucose 4-epimerase
LTGALSWIVGRGGLLGHNVAAAIADADPTGRLWLPEQPIPWQDRGEAEASLALEAERLLAEAERTERPWRLLWCAGTGVIATNPEALSQETDLLRSVLSAVQSRLARDPHLVSTGSLFVASSAGGVYAGGEPPFDESSVVAPISAYGREKLRQEELARNVAETSGLGLLLGRISNLYGPGQNFAKPQGLIAQVGLAALRRRPVSIYVPLDTIRDYLFGADAGRMIARTMLRQEDARDAGALPEVLVKIFASETDTTVASVLAAWRLALRRPLRFALSSSPTSHLQPRVLSFRSSVWPELRGQPTLLPIGIDAVRREQLAQVQRGAVH